MTDEKMYLAPPGSVCEVCGQYARHLVLMHIGGDMVGMTCVECEEKVMVQLGRLIGGDEGREGLQRWREHKAKRIWPDDN